MKTLLQNSFLAVAFWFSTFTVNKVLLLARHKFSIHYKEIYSFIKTLKSNFIGICKLEGKNKIYVAYLSMNVYILSYFNKSFSIMSVPFPILKGIVSKPWR